MTDVTRLLEAIRAGDRAAPQQLLALVYQQLRDLARAKMAREPAGHTLQATALVHEAWLRLGDQRFENRAHYFGIAAEALRRILIERARRRLATRHGGAANHVDLDHISLDDLPALPTQSDADHDLLALHEALDALAAHDPRKAELVRLRYFAGLTISQAAEILGISLPTAKRDWTYARTWLFRRISGS